MSRPRAPESTIKRVLGEYLSAGRKGRGKRDAAFAIELFEDYLNGYAYESLEPAAARVFERRFNAEGREHREFCELFGPERILPALPMFLGWFLIRKVMARAEDLGAVAAELERLVGCQSSRLRVDSSTGAPERRPSSSPIPLHGWHDVVQRRDQRLDIFRGDPPHDVHVHVLIVMHDAIPHPDDLGPRDLGVRLPEDRRRAAGGSADDLDQMRNGQLQGVVGIELRPGEAANLAADTLGHIEHVPRVDQVIHRGRAAAPRPGRDPATGD